MNQPNTDPVMGELREGILHITQKIDRLSVEADTQELKITQRDKNWEDFVDKTKINLNHIYNQLKSYQYTLEGNLKIMNKLIQKLRITATTQDFDKTKRMVDNWHTEQFITRQEFEYILEEEIKQFNLSLKDKNNKILKKKQ